MKFNTRFSPAIVPGVTAKGGLTDQHQKDDCDLNMILKRYRIGDLPTQPAGRYEDLTDLPRDLTEAYDKVSNARDWFMALPSHVRKLFGNDPRQAIDAALAGSPDDLKLLFPNLSQPAAAGTPEPPEAAKVAPATVANPPSPEESPAQPGA